MRHARVDYNERIQDAANLIGEDEPVFLLRAQDVTAPSVVRAWVKVQRDLSFPLGVGDPKAIQLAENWANEMERWQATHGCKTADISSEIFEKSKL